MPCYLLLSEFCNRWDLNATINLKCDVPLIYIYDDSRVKIPQCDISLLGDKSSLLPLKFELLLVIPLGDVQLLEFIRRICRINL